MTEKTFPYSDKVHKYSSISNKLFDVTTVSLILTLSYFSLLDIDLFCFGKSAPPVVIHDKKNF